MLKIYSKRFEDLGHSLEEIEQSKYISHGEWKSNEVDQELFDEWIVKARSLLVNACGNESQHFQLFVDAQESRVFEGGYDVFRRLRPIFKAAKDDYESGLLSNFKALVQAEIFDSELEQARELLKSKYIGAAAVVAGVVLETALRDMCIQNDIPISKLDKMNSDLAKAGAYNKFQQKRVTAIAELRNQAAHGHWVDLSVNNVEAMINDVEALLLSNCH